MAHVVAGATRWCSCPRAAAKPVLPGASHRAPAGGPGRGHRVSPLIALMHDQVGALHEAGVEAPSLNSTLDGEKRWTWSSACARRDHPAVRRARAADHASASWPARRPVRARAAVACSPLTRRTVSQWGHDFRPEYRQLTVLHERYASVPRIASRPRPTDALTRADIVERLQLQEARQFVSSFDRPNIRYRIVEKEGRHHAAAALHRARTEDAGVVYCQSRKRVEELADTLCRPASTPPALPRGPGAEVRQRHQDRFREEGHRDGGDHRLRHGHRQARRALCPMDMPKNIEGYYQETGRAGRDGLPRRRLDGLRPGRMW